MKKIILAIAMLASLQVANAQVKSSAALQAAVETAKAAADNPKKATKVATWMKLGEVYMNAFNAPAGNGILGQPMSQIKVLMAGTKPISSEKVDVNGDSWTKEVYAGSNYYYDSADVLQCIEITKPIINNALEEALKAYNKAAEVDAAGTKKAEIETAIKDICQKYVEEGYTAYTFNDFAKASKKFESAANASKSKGAAGLDPQYLYNAGFTAINGGDNARAKEMFEACLANGFEAKDGEVYAKLATACDNLGDKTAAKEYLEKGFTKYPQSQGILIGLINYYMTDGSNTDKLFQLVDEAKKNEPTNASLWYVEGNIHTQLKQYDEAKAAYEKCAEINPAYEYGFIGEGIMYYNRAIEIQEAAQEELDDAKYMALVADFEKNLKGCIEPFEKAFAITKQDDVKLSIAEYLKNACYRFRDENDTYKQAYEKYNAMLKSE